MKKIISLLFLCASTFSLASCGAVDPSTPETPSPSVATGYTVQFNTHGGTTVSTITNVSYIETSPVTTKTNYTFDGWFEEATYENEITFPYTVTKHMTMHAKWEATETTYVVRFETYGGTAVADQITSLIEEEPVTTKENYTFKGWYTSNAFTNKVTFPYEVTKTQTLYAKWENDNIANNNLVLTATTSMGTASAYLKASYEDTYVNVDIDVKDNYILNNLTNVDGSVNGMNDNVELFVTYKANQVTGLIQNNSTKVIVVPAQKYSVDTFSYSNDGYVGNFNYKNVPNSGFSVKSSLSALISHGYTGYGVNIQIPYAYYGINKAQALNNISLYLAMRNSDTSMNISTYAESSFLNSQRRHAWTHPILKEDGTFFLKDVTTLYIGDSYTDSQFYRTQHIDFANLDFCGRGISGSKVSEWYSMYYQRITAHKPENIVFHIGVNDIHGANDKSGTTTYPLLEQLFNKIHADLPNTTIYWTTITNNHFKGVFTNDVNEYEVAYAYYNEHVKTFALTNNFVKVIDLASKLQGKVSYFIDDGLHLNAAAYNIWAKLIYEALSFNWIDGSIFGKAGDLETSRGYDLSKDNQGIISTVGFSDQYAFIKGNGATTFTLSADLTATKVNNGDGYPKMGLVIKSQDKMIFFFVDMFAALNGQSVGYCYAENHGTLWGYNFNWSTAQAVAQSIVYTGNNSVNLTMKLTTTAIELYVNKAGTPLFTIEDTYFVGNTCYTGLLSFNTSYIAKNITYSI